MGYSGIYVFEVISSMKDVLLQSRSCQEELSLLSPTLAGEPGCNQALLPKLTLAPIPDPFY